jgi:nucleoside phosphorylase
MKGNEVIAIVAAWEEEIRPLRRLKLDQILLVKSGMGHENVRKSLEFILQRGPSAVISTGFAGALLKGVQTGELILSEEVLLEGITDGFRPDKALLKQAVKTLEGIGIRYHLGATLTLKKMATEPNQKRELAACYSAIAIDRESYWVAEGAHSWGVPFLYVRAVLDGMDERLPVSFVDEGGKLHLLRAFAQMPNLIRLAKRAQKAGEGIRRFMVPFLAAI